MKPSQSMSVSWGTFSGTCSGYRRPSLPQAVLTASRVPAALAADLIGTLRTSQPSRCGQPIRASWLGQVAQIRLKPRYTEEKK